MATYYLPFITLLVILLLAFEPTPTQAKFPIRSLLASCQPSGHLAGTTHSCDTSNGAECCKSGKSYPQYKCSPPVTSNTKATLTLNCFEKGCDGGAESECDNKFHSNKEKIVALSTGWYKGGSRCGKKIKISANGKSVLAKVVDECDSVNGCDSDHDYQPPCHNDIVDASQAVWDALGLDSNIGEVSVTWSLA